MKSRLMVQTAIVACLAVAGMAGEAAAQQAQCPTASGLCTCLDGSTGRCEGLDNGSYQCGGCGGINSCDPNSYNPNSNAVQPCMINGLNGQCAWKLINGVQTYSCQQIPVNTTNPYPGGLNICSGAMGTGCGLGVGATEAQGECYEGFCVPQNTFCYAAPPGTPCQRGMDPEGTLGGTCQVMNGEKECLTPPSGSGSGSGGPITTGSGPGTSPVSPGSSSSSGGPGTGTGTYICTQETLGKPCASQNPLGPGTCGHNAIVGPVCAVSGCASAGQNCFLPQDYDPYYVGVCVSIRNSDGTLGLECTHNTF